MKPLLCVHYWVMEGTEEQWRCNNHVTLLSLPVSQWFNFAAWRMNFPGLPGGITLLLWASPEDLRSNLSSESWNSGDKLPWSCLGGPRHWSCYSVAPMHWAWGRPWWSQTLVWCEGGWQYLRNLAVVGESGAFPRAYWGLRETGGAEQIEQHLGHNASDLKNVNYYTNITLTIFIAFL